MGLECGAEDAGQFSAEKTTDDPSPRNGEVVGAELGRVCLAELRKALLQALVQLCAGEPRLMQRHLNEGVMCSSWATCDALECLKIG